MAAVVEKPVVIKPPEVVATHDFLLIGWILLLLMGAPLVGLGLLSLIVGILGFAGYAPAMIVALLSTGSVIIDSWTAFFAFAFLPITTLVLGALALAFYLLLVGAIYFLTVRRTATGNYEGARGASLFFGVILILLSLASFAAFLSYDIFAAAALLILPALFFLMGYGKLGEVVARYGPVAVLSDAAPLETAPQVPSAAPVPAMPAIAAPSGPALPAMPMMAAPTMGMGTVSVPASAPAIPTSPVPPTPPAMPPYQHLGGAVPRVPLCPTCGRELYYAQNYRRWYCLVCESRR